MRDTMKLHYMYWTLLLISFISSGVLFLIVASEGIPETVSKFKNKHELLDNITVRDIGKNNEEIIETLNLLNSEFELELNNKAEQENKYSVDELTINDGNSASDIPQANNLNVLKESLTQQPNLSQGKKLQRYKSSHTGHFSSGNVNEF
ncbi:hypothetical protein PV327_009278 [Microctonus hyperodae]|uniref:Uncharacterized protein n=1 Tax=Microctonus hyperodae TaxID=165561 RepID=A0AA39FUI0_MICHY|nr:hypothetical protein PV327_009278 [Microctonus hyperodae]